jgi:hypothetical protein
MGKRKRKVFNIAKYLLLILFASSIIILFLHKGWVIYKTNWWIDDDAFISFRYAENWANGKGLVYNEGEKVEGYTNFLWTLIIGIFIKVRANPLWSSLILSLIFSLLTAILLFKLSCATSKTKTWMDGIPPLLLVSSGIWVGWGLSGLETDLFTFLLVLGTYLAFKDSLYSPLIFALLVMTRPDGIIFFGLIFLWKLIFERRLDFKFLGIFLIIYLPYYAWRYLYYGWPFPNSFYAKVGTGMDQYKTGYIYVCNFFFEQGGFFFLPAILAISRLRFFLFYLISVLVFSFYIIYIGGDYWPGGRYLVPVLPFLYILVKEGLSFLFYRAKSIGMVISTLIFIFLAIYGASHSFKGEFYNLMTTHKMHIDGKTIGEYMKKIARPNQLLATNTAGTIAYYSKIKVLDMLGINDLHIAHKEREKEFAGIYPGHEKRDGPYVLSRKPDYIILGYSSITAPMLPSDVCISDTKEFIENYEPVIVPIRLSVAPCFIYYQRLPINEEKPKYLEEIPVINYQPIENIKAMEMVWDVGTRYFKRGGLAYNSQDMDWAIVEFKKAISCLSLNPNKNFLIESYYWMGMAYLKKKDKEMAKESFQKVLELDPNNLFAKQSLQTIEQKNSLDRD